MCPPSRAFLQAMTYADSAYPSGRYTLSHGLEGLVQAHRVTGVEQVGAALVDHLRYTAAPGDGVATACAALLAGDSDQGLVEGEVSEVSEVSDSPGALRIGERQKGADTGDPTPLRTDLLTTLQTLDHELSATKVTCELRQASSRVGRQMLQVTDQVEHRLSTPQPWLLRSYAQMVAAKETPGNQAIAAGLIHASHGMTPAQAVATELTGLTVGWAGAAVRLRQCDHIDAQVIITAVHPVIAELTAQCVARAGELLDTGQWRLLGRASPGSDLASAAHETAPARLFMS